MSSLQVTPVTILWTMAIDPEACLSHSEMYLARVLFVNRVLSSRGQAFEDLFTRVMHRTVSGFRPIKPQGKFGDRKNDGYVREEGRYWQVYAPSDPHHRIKVAIDKLETDFRGLKAYWDAISPIKEYSFAFNDRYEGGHPSVEEALSKIQKEHGLIKCEPFLAKDLEDQFLSMNRNDIVSVVGLIPDPIGLDSLEYTALSEVLGFMAAQRKPISLASLLVAPDFEDKIQFNDIGPTVAGLLRLGSYQNGVVDDYFRRNSQFTRRGVRDHLSATYAQVRSRTKAAIPSGVYPGDVVFFRLLESVMPVNNALIQDAAIALIAYFFESCDVFEEPQPRT